MSKYQTSSCLRKRRFPTEAEALEASNGFRVYRCPVCGGYHLTSQGSAKSEPLPEVKPTFETSILARARWKR
jgi:hypothetical protein